jgi:agmatinase
MTFDPNAAAPPDSGVFGLSSTPAAAKVILIPVPFEVTTSYGGGTSRGPQAILEASKQVDLFDLDTGKPYAHGIAMLEEPAHIWALNAEGKALAQPIIASAGIGDHEQALGRINEIGAALNEHVYGLTKHWIAQKKLVGLIGGDHATPFGCIAAHAEAYDNLGILHLDAHADLRDAYEGFKWSHASIMFNVMNEIPKVHNLVQVGIRDFGEAEFEFIQQSKGRIHTFFDARLQRAQLEGMPWREQVDAIVQVLPKNVYLSWDIDGLDPTLCPNTGTPVPGGLSFAQAVALLEGLVRHQKRIVGFDLNEVSPGDGTSQWDGNVAARLLYKMIGYALRSLEP